MSWGKRVFDLGFLLLISPVVVPVGALVALTILIVDGRPVFFAQERMRAPGQPFTLWKFRTMKPDPADAGVSGGDKANRITPLGRVLRRLHADEIPQAWNVIRGDVSLVGPRPPLRRYVEMFPELYGRVLQSRPGLTGMGSVFFSRHEAWVLARSRSGAETEAAYVRRCIPRKARLDMIYARNRSVGLDLWLIWMTLRRIAGRGRRRG